MLHNLTGLVHEIILENVVQSNSANNKFECTKIDSF